MYRKRYKGVITKHSRAENFEEATLSSWHTSRKYQHRLCTPHVLCYQQLLFNVTHWTMPGAYKAISGVIGHFEPLVGNFSSKKIYKRRTTQVAFPVGFFVHWRNTLSSMVNFSSHLNILYFPTNLSTFLLLIENHPTHAIRFRRI